MQSYISGPPDIAGTGIESREMVYRDHLVHYLAAGTGPPVIFLHGGASDCTDWIPAMFALSGKFTMYAPDLPGFGRSQRNGTGYYLTDFIEFLEEFIRTQGLEKAALVGHSFGGRVCLGVALEHPEMVDRLVLVDAAGMGKTSLLGLVLVTFFDRVRKLLRKPLPNPTFLSRDGDDPDWACVEDLPNVKVPALIIWHRLDPYLSVANARRAVKMMPDAVLEVMPGYGHAPHRAHAETFYRLLVDFVNGTGTSPGD